MNTRKTITEQKLIRIPVKVDTYKVDLFWKDFIKAEVLENDIVLGFKWQEETAACGFGGNSIEDSPEYKVPYIIVSRDRVETDNEFLNRQILEVERQKQLEEKEKLEYLRLHAKYGNQ